MPGGASGAPRDLFGTHMALGCALGGSLMPQRCHFEMIFNAFGRLFSYFFEVGGVSDF